MKPLSISAKSWSKDYNLSAFANDLKIPVIGVIGGISHEELSG
jgi:hypothetical protein